MSQPNLARVERLMRLPLATPERILARVRSLMTAGILRPHVAEIARGVVTVEAVNRYWETLPLLYAAALDHEPTRAAVLALLMPNGPLPASDDCDRILRAVVAGRLRP